MAFTQPRRGPLHHRIERACSPTFAEPDLGLNLEVCDLISSKPLVYPKQAAKLIVQLINHRNVAVAYKAASLLDTCMKNCGYPFHLQMASRDILNEMVRRFPENPPASYSRVQKYILELVEQWQVTLCTHAKYARDLECITAMYNLLGRKGYQYPGFSERCRGVLMPQMGLMSEKEREEEDRVVKEAKLQELLQRGTPADLEQANKLMQDLVGYKREGEEEFHDTYADTPRGTQETYASEFRRDLGRLRQSLDRLIIGLSEIRQDNVSGKLESLKDAYGECLGRQPKIRKLIQDDLEGTHVDVLLEMNDDMNTFLELYKDLRDGRISVDKLQQKVAAQSTRDVSEETQGPVEKAKFDESLIDLWEPSSEETSDTGTKRTQVALPVGPMNELLGDLQSLEVGGEDFLASPPASLQPQQTSTEYASSVASILSKFTPQSLGANQSTLSQDHSGSHPSKETVQDSAPSAVDSALEPAQLIRTINKGASRSAGQSHAVKSVSEIFNSSGMRVVVQLHNEHSSECRVILKYRNTTLGEVLSELDAKVAVPKSMTAHVSAPSSTTLDPDTDSIQEISIRNPQQECVRLRLKFNFKKNGEAVSAAVDFR